MDDMEWSRKLQHEQNTNGEALLDFKGGVWRFLYATLIWKLNIGMKFNNNFLQSNPSGSLWHKNAGIKCHGELI